MSGRPRYQRDAGGIPQRNGEIDGWMRPLGNSPNAWTAGGDPGKYMKRGNALSCRYWAAWVVRDLGHHPELRCNFDNLQEALDHIAAHPDVKSGGVYDRRRGRWAA